MTDEDARARARREAEEEFRFHIEAHARLLESEGYTPEAARREALARFGDVERARAETVRLDLQHPPRRWGLVPGVGRDTRDAFRALRRHPFATFTAVAMIAVGMAGATIVFATTSALLSPPSDARDPETLVSLYTSTDADDPFGRTSLDDFETLRRRLPGLEGVSALGDGIAVLDEEATAPQLLFEVVSANFFDVAGIPLAAGRGFAPDEDGIGTAQRVVIFGHHIWQDRFGGDRSIVGRTVRLSGHPYTVVGVAAPGITSRQGLPLRVDGWVPLGIDDPLSDVRPALLLEPGQRHLSVVARMAPGVTIEALRAQLDTIGTRLADEQPGTWRTPAGAPRRFAVVPDRESRIAPQIRPRLVAVGALLLFGALLVLAAAALNVGSVFVSRWESRWREFGVRLAIGSGRWPLLRLLLLESTMVAVASAALGIWLTRAALRVMSTISLPVSVPITINLMIDDRTLLFAAGLAIVTGIGIGWLPARRATGLEPSAALRRGSGPTSSGRKSRLQQTMLVAQVAASAVLVACAGVLVRGLQDLGGTNPGFDSRGVAVVTTAPGAAEADGAARRARQDQLLDRLRARPEIAAAALAGAVEVTFLNVLQSAEVRIDAGQSPQSVSYNAVDRGYFPLLDMRVARGRAFNGRDRFGAAPTAIVNEEFVSRFWPGESGLGRRFLAEIQGWGDAAMAAGTQSLEVVGVAPTGKYRKLDELPTPYFWISLDQHPSLQLTVLVKGRGGVADAVAALREDVALADGESVVVPPTPLDNLVALGTFVPRLASRALTYAGLIGLVVAVVGVYGMVSLAIVNRRREAMVRLALGARAGQVAWLLARSAVRLTLVGALVGLMLAVPILFTMRSVLAGLRPLEPVTLPLTLLILVGTGLLASVLPASRVRRFDVAEVVRSE